MRESVRPPQRMRYSLESRRRIVQLILDGRSRATGASATSASTSASCCTSTLDDPLRQIALGSTRLAVRSVLVNGRFALRDSEVVGVDEAAILAAGRELGAEIVARHDEAFAVGQELLASVRAGWLEAMRSDVGVERKLWPAS